MNSANGHADAFIWLLQQAAMEAAHYAAGGETLTREELLDLPESRAVEELQIAPADQVGRFFALARQIGVEEARKRFRR